MDESIRKQLEKPQTWFCKYFPKRIQNVGEKEIADRQMVYDFKDGRSHEAVAQMTAARMIEEHGSGCSQLVFIPVPASSVRKNEIRYMDFCRRVCELTGAINGYDHVRVCGERLAVHENRKAEKEIRKVSIIEFDEEWFKDKTVIVFDDVITRGISWRVSERMSLKASSLQKPIIKYRTMNGILSEKSKSLAFTGHRTVPVERQDEIRARLVEAVSVACKSGITCFYSGMAMGFDLMAAETVLSLKGRYPDIRLIAVVPFRRQSCRWPSMENERYQNIISRADRVIVLSEHYFKGCLLRRNDFMLEHSCGVIAYYDGKTYGGTFYTYREARKRCIDIINLY